MGQHGREGAGPGSEVSRRSVELLAEGVELASQGVEIFPETADLVLEFRNPAAADVVSVIKKAGGPNLDKRTVQLPKAHIKSVGSHEVTIRLHAGVEAKVSLNVVAE